MKLVIPGGAGQIGTILARHFTARGDSVTILSRTMHAAPWPVVQWDAKTFGDWASHIDGADVVINLAGRTVNCRYTKANLKQMLDSRVDSTRAVGQAIARSKSPPRVWLQASTATIYAHQYDAPNDELTGRIGGTANRVGHPERGPDLWALSEDIGLAWERTLDEAQTPNTRTVAMRSAMTMSPDQGGIFDTLLTLVRRGLGGRAGDGRQYVSWVHDRDFISTVDWLIGRDELSGPVNICSPNPLPFDDFMHDLRRAYGARIGLPATKWMLEIGAYFMRTETELVLKSRRVVPTRLLQSGFRFAFPGWPAAAADLCRRVR